MLLQCSMLCLKRFYAIFNCNSVLEFWMVSAICGCQLDKVNRSHLHDMLVHSSPSFNISVGFFHPFYCLPGEMCKFDHLDKLKHTSTSHTSLSKSLTQSSKSDVCLSKPAKWNNYHVQPFPFHT